MFAAERAVVSGADGSAEGEAIRFRGRMRAGLLAFVLVLGLVGGVAALWQASIWPLNQGSERALMRRAQQFWDMKIAGDAFGAYGLMAESYRRRVTPSGFVRGAGGPIEYLGARVRSAKVEDGKGEVEIEIDYVFNKPHFKDMAAKSEAKERWVFENGGWYRWPPAEG
jgi:hypothetical protein